MAGLPLRLRAPAHGPGPHGGEDVAAGAAFDGAVTSLSRARGTLVLSADRGRAAGWSAVDVHLDDDTPGTDDGRGSELSAVPAGLEVGSRVLAGQLVGRRGDSGNAEEPGPHLHVELRRGSGWQGTVVDAHPSLLAALGLTAPPGCTLSRRPTSPRCPRPRCRRRPPARGRCCASTASCSRSGPTGCGRPR